MVKIPGKNIIKIKGNSYERLKQNILKYGAFIILFVLIFDKLTLSILFSLYYAYKRYFTNSKEQFTKLDYSGFDTSNNNLSYNPMYSQIFKNTGLNLKSYNNVAIDPTKVLFENNKFLPECCLYNSEYSTSKGCACITPTQQEYLRRRGTNKSESSFIQNNSKYTNLFFSPTLAFQGESFPFKNNTTSYIVEYPNLTSEKINEFANLTNLIDSRSVNYSPTTNVAI